MAALRLAGGLLGRLLLVLIWLLLLTPAGLILRLTRRDPLGLRPGPPGESYWRPVAATDDRPQSPL